MRYWPAALAILVSLSASIALADDFKTINGKEYKNVTVTRVEPDGIMIKFSGGLVKIPFTGLPQQVQQSGMELGLRVSFGLRGDAQFGLSMHTAPTENRFVVRR